MNRVADQIDVATRRVPKVMAVGATLVANRNAFAAKAAPTSGRNPKGHDRYLEVPLRSNRSKGVMQDNAYKYDHADVLIMQESPEAASCLTVAGKPLVPGHQHRGEGN